VIRVNSQSGKGGIAYLMETEHGVVMPRRLAGRVLRRRPATHRRTRRRSHGDDIWRLFSATYLESTAPVRYREHHLFEHGSAQGIRLSGRYRRHAAHPYRRRQRPDQRCGARLQSAGINIQVRSYEERSMVPIGEDGNARACAFMEMAGKDSGERYGVGIDSNIVTASLKALISGINRLGFKQIAEKEAGSLKPARQPLAAKFDARV
jgi:2-isopropylmalate synthase